MGYDYVLELGEVVLHKNFTYFGTFNPRTNKADLVDVECGLAEIYELNITTAKNIVVVRCFDYETPTEICYHVQTVSKSIEETRAEAVMSVVSKIYDARYGKDGE